MLTKFVVAGAVTLGIAIGSAGVAAADARTPGPNSLGPFVTESEPSGKAACEAASIATGNYSSCYWVWDDGKMKYYFDRS
ncbi:hypothetical protein [Nocardia sp. NPDC051570]|uniref:hypothetical protein n=1 Tax=Nocardia sp. NPDC051570 TaxID=3364324 RepID=UPI0037AD7994